MYVYLCPCMLDLKITQRRVIKNILFTKRTQQHIINVKQNTRTRTFY